ncbi:MAG: hypothetical protein JOY82_16765 [Streptosporangiaceae bacterium]|nr:hypothetical protein [Streptosporangiaceae bacterium]MBV9856145.1 hypothetical protein [Streptosporangiaceae bacterium]
MTRSAAYLYPWDVDGDPDAAKRIADLGIQEVVLAAAYHSVRAVTPFHPRHRIVTRDAGVYYHPAPERWRGLPLRPAVPKPSGPEAPDPAGSFERAAEQLRAAGLRVAAWVVVAHSEALGAAHPEFTVHNAFGDPYPWALCVASPDVRDYAATLAADVAALAWADGIELEACGWYGFGHLSAHDKTGGQPAGPAGWMLDVCFCASCEDACRRAGLNPGELRGSVRAAADAGFGGPPPAAGLPSDLEDALQQVRAAVAADFLRDVIASARASAPGKPVFVHSHPDLRETGANPGFGPAVLLGPGGADGMVLACPGPPAESAKLVSRVAAAAPGSPRIAANLTAVSALGGRPAELRAQAEAVLSAGATELRFYHAGLASPADLSAIRDVTGTTFGESAVIRGFP